MNPVFKEYCKFLKDSVDLELEEGFYWLDNHIIKAFDKHGNIHKLYRIVIDDDLSVKYKIPHNYETIEDFDLASWSDIVEMHCTHLECLETEAKQLICEKMDKFNTYIPLIPVSMGKDSQVTCHLVRECCPDAKAIFNNTTLDCPDTYLMAKKFPNCKIMNPKQGFYQYIKRAEMIPTRFSRFCCRIFKVGEMVNQLDHSTPYLIFMGMRNEESNTRSEYGDEWINEAEWGNTKWQGILPIRTWSELDVWLYILWKDIEINPKYRKGYSRQGCSIACPFYGKSTWVLDKYWYPTQRKRWEDILKEDFISNSKWLILNCTLDEYVNQAWSGGIFREEPTEKVIKEYSAYSGIEEEVAARYFNKYCANGCKSKSGKLKKIKEKEVIGMNLKYHGRNINRFYCKKCLEKMYGWNEQKWIAEVEKFKEQGCVLF